MIRDFNTREFRIVCHGMNDAKELLAMNEPKSALAALREPKKNSGTQDQQYPHSGFAADPGSRNPHFLAAL